MAGTCCWCREYIDLWTSVLKAEKAALMPWVIVLSTISGATGQQQLRRKKGLMKDKSTLVSPPALRLIHNYGPTCHFYKK
jgi:hypothetical protein